MNLPVSHCEVGAELDLVDRVQCCLEGTHPLCVCPTQGTHLEGADMNKVPLPPPFGLFLLLGSSAGTDIPKRSSTIMEPVIWIDRVVECLLAPEPRPTPSPSPPPSDTWPAWPCRAGVQGPRPNVFSASEAVAWRLCGGFFWILQHLSHKGCIWNDTEGSFVVTGLCCSVQIFCVNLWGPPWWDFCLPLHINFLPLVTSCFNPQNH